MDTSKFKNANGLSVMRLLVDGKQSDLDVRWLYYHLTSTDGRRMTVVFTIEQDLEDEFAAADRLLVNDVRFKTKPITAAQRSSRNQNRKPSFLLLGEKVPEGRMRGPPRQFGWSSRRCSLGTLARVSLEVG